MAVPAVVALCVAMAGCGSGGSTGPPAAAQTTAQTTAAQTAAAPSTAGSPTGTGRGKPAVTERLAFTGRTLDGAEFDAASLAGKPVVLWFWAPWCPKCRAAGPEVAKTAAQHAGKLTVLGVAGLSNDTGSMREFVTATNTGGLTHLSDPSGGIWKRFGVTAQDTYVLIGADGSVTHTGPLPIGEFARRVGALAG
jgi:thiol-disulfide isomerase/thioredoxin